MLSGGLPVAVIPYIDALTALRDKAYEEMIKSEGWIISEKIEKLEISLAIFQYNFIDIKTILEEFDNGTSLLLFDVRNTDELNRFLLEVTRLLHNYVASAMSLVDHTRILKKELYNVENHEDFNEEYEAEIETNFKLNPIHQFIQGLRNYIIHKGLPPISGNLDLNMIKTTITINFEHLLEDFQWSKLAKEYMIEKGKEEELKSILLGYYKLVTNFHNWFFNRQKEIHAEEFRETNDLRERIANSKWTIKFP